MNIMLISGCCGFRFVVEIPHLHAKHLRLRLSSMLWKSLPNSLTTPHCAHCLHLAWCVGFYHHPALSNSGSFCPLYQEPGKNRTGLSLLNVWASCQSDRSCQAWILLAFSVASPICLSLKLHHVGHPLSNLRLYYLPRVSYFSEEFFAHRVRVDCYLFTKSSSCYRWFLTGRLLSSFAVL